ncbi:MAG: sulfurtransferase [Fibrobacter sp.]|jgi:thiosulfate/3-mercaptopyruvate sulfurtransferase|nr:sulfurtransferase [Fibrobacter sp.]
MTRYYCMSLMIISILAFTTKPIQANDFQRKIDPIVSTEWLAANLNKGIKIIDLRSSDDYATGHITSSVNSPADGWWVTRDNLLLELPEEEDLRAKIGELGINAASRIVLVNTAENDFDRAQTARVAWTLIYAGIANVAILDGGYNRWIAEGRVLSKESVTPQIAVYNGPFNQSVLASKNFVSSHMFYSRIIDSRIPEDFFGVTTPPEFTEKSGHIAGAVNLPAPWAFTSDGLYKDRDTIAAMARGVVGLPSYRKNIVYCGVGGFAATWWYLLSEVLSYPNTSLYDGSIQEWTLDPRAPVQKYTW